MSEILGKTMQKAFTVLIIAVVIISVGESILTDDTTKDFFGELMGNLPFAKPIADVIANLMKLDKKIPLDGPKNVFRDMLVLLIMSSIRRPVMTLLSMIFLKVPNSNDYAVIEKHMESLTYKIKESFLNVLCAPGIAFMASVLINYIIEFVKSKFGKLSFIVLFIILVILFLFSLLSLTLGKGGLSFDNAVRWRFFITLCGELLSTLCILGASIWIYLAIYFGYIEYLIFIIVPFLILFLFFQAQIDNLSRLFVDKKYLFIE